MPDCAYLVDTFVKAVAGGDVNLQGEEFQLICAIVNKVMSQRGGPANKRTNSQIIKLLKESSKNQIIDFVQDKGGKLGAQERLSSEILDSQARFTNIQYVVYYYDPSTPT